MKRFVKKSIIVLILISSLFIYNYSFADPFDNTMRNLQGTATMGGYKTSGVTEHSLASTLGKAVNIIASFLGIIFALLIIYAGFVWMFAGGDENEIKKAKGIIKNSIIGLAIVLSAYAITSFVMKILTTSIS